jgi:NAD(P)-dependent dehydrogenase (short-subunit alcohol dehydrogenase family)
MRDPAKSPDLSAFASAASLPIVVSAMDVDSDDSVRQGVGDILAQHGPLDVLVNNAGIERRGSVEELALDEFRAVMETNYFGVIRCIKAVLPGMRTRGSGCIINVTSVAGRISVSPLGPYSASKFAPEGLSEALAHEVTALASGLRLCSVASSTRIWPTPLHSAARRSSARRSTGRVVHGFAENTDWT